MPEEEECFLLRFTPAELSKLEYLVRQRFNHENRRDIALASDRIREAHIFKIELLEGIMDKFERVRAGV